jgi:hypothetical protein
MKIHLFPLSSSSPAFYFSQIINNQTYLVLVSYLLIIKVNLSNTSLFQHFFHSFRFAVSSQISASANYSGTLLSDISQAKFDGHRITNHCLRISLTSSRLSLAFSSQKTLPSLTLFPLATMSKKGLYSLQDPPVPIRRSLIGAKAL